MEVYTSCYDHVPNLDKEAYTYIRVSRKEPPPWFVAEYAHVDMSSSFGPSEAMLHDCHPLEKWDIFKPRYISEVLGALDNDATLKTLQDAYESNGNRPLLLLCYETAQQKCHRHLIGDHLGFKTTEL